ncbi:Pathogenicity locus [Salipaludibacillus keqinensis]|uniref:Pathogenicity locus n=1 Tax=Salipaludibacillus keqinensis TaxID=2045207 RepID=A0A323TAE3_9BACI|nr:helix-hairpin-helix domain-containing protein [Salipaludibacillus keqinensis]PYZ91956.1 Pathogenicity locus [Salipaludibacillus keqinensis]
MPSSNNPKLPLTKSEKASLRKAHINLRDINSLSVNHISDVLAVPYERAQTLKALASFQQIPSIGHKMAEKMVYELGIYSLDELIDKDGGKLLDQLEQKIGVWTDPCVEDQIRCMIYFAKHRESNRKWYDFTKERKLYRVKHGYPESRPHQAWYE